MANGGVAEALDLQDPNEELLRQVRLDMLGTIIPGLAARGAQSVLVYQHTQHRLQLAKPMFCCGLQIYQSYLEEARQHAPAVKAEDIFKTDLHFWSKNKIFIRNNTAGSVHFTVESVPDLILKRLEVALWGSATGAEVKAAVERELSPLLRRPQDMDISTGDTIVFYLGPNSSYVYACTQQNNYVRLVPAKKLLVYSG